MNKEDIPFWIFLGDVHGEFHQIHKIDSIEKAQGVVITGDIGRVGTRKEVLQFLDILHNYNKVIFAQIGNIDSFDVNRLFNIQQINLHKKIVRCKDFCLMGIGGSLPTPFGIKSEYSEEYYQEVLNTFALQKKEMLTILVSHNPPYKTHCDQLKQGSHVGSKALLEFLKGYQPEFCVCGHIHEARGQDVIGKTQVYNLGDFASGYYGKLLLSNIPVFTLCSFNL